MRTFKDGKTAITIMTYKHTTRRTEILDYANKFDTDRYDVYIISQDNDPSKDELKKYETDKIKILYPSVTSIFQKRHWVLEWTKDEHYKYLVQIDDDLSPHMYYLQKGYYTEGGSLKVTKEPYGLNKLIDIMHERIIEYNGGICGPIMRGMLGMADEDKIGNVYLTRMVTNLIIIDVQKAYTANIEYEPSGELAEDIDLCIKFLQEGYYSICLPDYGWSESDINGWSSGKASVIYKSQDDMNKLFFGFCLKYHIPPKEIKNGRVKVQSIRGDKFFGTHKLPKLDPELKKICEDRDMNALEAYINKNNKKLN